MLPKNGQMFVIPTGIPTWLEVDMIKPVPPRGQQINNLLKNSQTVWRGYSNGNCHYDLINSEFSIYTLTKINSSERTAVTEAISVTKYG